MSTTSSVAAIRRLQITRKGARNKLASYPNEVLVAAIAAENAASDARPMFIQMLEAEIERRSKEPSVQDHATYVVPTPGRHAIIPLGELSPSPHNRKRFDRVKLDELTENVRQQGVIVPIIARPIADRATPYEIVAGERRWRAAGSAGLGEIPAIVRELTEAQAIELMLIENNKREDVHPLEEAEGYEALMKCTHADGTHFTAEEIAAKVGKSKAYVYGRLKLTALCQEGRDAFYEGKLDASRALLLARIPGAELQTKALREITEDKEYGDGPMAYREAADHVQWNYMLRLNEAPFKTADANLLPAAGACSTCPKRSGNQPELFADIESADVCTDPTCFGQKRDAHLEQMRAQAEAKGKDVVAPRAKGFVKLDDRVKGDYSGRTYREILGAKAPTPQLMPDVEGDKAKLVEVVRKADVQEIVAKKLEKQRTGAGGFQQRDWERERLEREAFGELLFTHLAAAIPEEPSIKELRPLVEQLIRYTQDSALELVAALFLQDGKKAGGRGRLTKVLDQLSFQPMLRLLVALSYGDEIDQPEERLSPVAKGYGIDVKAIEAAALASVEAAEQAKATPKSKRKAKDDAAAEVAPA